MISDGVGLATVRRDARSNRRTANWPSGAMPSKILQRFDGLIGLSLPAADARVFNNRLSSRCWIT